MFIELRSQESVDSKDISSFKPVDDVTQPTATKYRILIELVDGTSKVDIWPSSAERDIALNNLRVAMNNRKI